MKIGADDPQRPDRPGSAPSDPGDVAVAGLWRRRGSGREILLTRRAREGHLGGLWELPGGKLEPGESVAEALRRELREELGLAPGRLEPLVCVEHRYPDRRVRLHVMVGPMPAGAPAPACEHRWVGPEALDGVPLPAANAAINAALRQHLLSRPLPRGPGRGS